MHDSVDPGEPKPGQGLGSSLDRDLTLHCMTHTEAAVHPSNV